MPNTLLYILLCVWVVHFIAQTSSYDPSSVNLNAYLQPDDVTPNQFLSGKYCARNCKKNEAARTCYYRWTIQDYVTVSNACGSCPDNMTDCYQPQCVTADGYEKGIITVNRRIPGPHIGVCLGDRIIVDVINKMAGRSSTIHWHGVFQKGTPYMDGVPGVTQCSILEGETFRYDFWGNNEGTHYWHSHDGLQKLDGIQGSLVIRTPKSDDPNRALYDYDFTVWVVLDWMHIKADDKFPGYRYHWLGQDADSFLLNGRGRTELPKSQGNRSANYPRYVTNVYPGKKYRIRIVGALCTVCGVQLSIEGHSMTVIATDGNPVKPVKVNSINIYSGERYDVVLTTNQPPKSYWVHMKGLGLCATTQVYGLAILRYLTASNEAMSAEPGYDGFPQSIGRTLNPENATCGGGSGNICVTELENATPMRLSNSKDNMLPMAFAFHDYEVDELFRSKKFEPYFIVPDGSLLTSMVNNISYTAPSSPLLSQGEESRSQMCPTGRYGLPACPAKKMSRGFCECTHVIKLPLRSTVDMILTDSTPTGDLHHPFHLHGHAFTVLSIGQFRNGQNIWDLYNGLKSGRLALAKNPPFKDAVAVPSNGYAIIRFYADNPGYWFFHCHFMYHLATGMAVVFQVGNEWDWPPVPEGFPRCGNFLPPVYNTYNPIHDMY